MVIDTHVHTSPYWFEPVEVLLFEMNRNGVDKATLVQHFGQTDNSYIIECTRKFSGRLSPIVQVDTQHADASKNLRKLVNKGAEGIRLKATTRSLGNEPLAIWRTCAELSLPVTCYGKEEEFASDEFRKLVKALPTVPIIIEHLGYPQRGELPPYITYQKILSLACYQNTYIKVGGLGEICERPLLFRRPFTFDHVPPFIQMAYNTFGPLRMMWGSNYPPCSHLEGYGNTLHYLEEYLSTFCNDKAKEWIFGKTALSLFKFRQ
jgi:L-fuconolactonase